MLSPKVKIGDTVLRRKRNGGELDTWVTCVVNETYLLLINEFPDDYRKGDGEPLDVYVSNGSDVTAKRIVEKLGEYVNGLDRRHIGMPMMDEIAVMQMEDIVSQLLANPFADVTMPEYD